MMTDGIDIDAVRGIPVKRYHTIIVGTGAAGYAATDCLYRYGVTDIAIVTEGRTMGTEIPVQINRPITSLHYAVSSRIRSEIWRKPYFPDSVWMGSMHWLNQHFL